MSAYLENPVAIGLEKISFFSPIPKKGSDKEYSDYQTIVLTSHASKVKVKVAQSCLTLCDPMDCSRPGSSVSEILRLCSKSFKLGFSSIWIENRQMYKMGLEKTEEPDIKLPTFFGSWRKQENSRKNICLWFTD